MSNRIAPRAALILALLICLGRGALPARASAFAESDTSALASVNEAIKAFEDDVSSALHDLPSGDVEQIESYAYVGLNLEAAHERLNNIFMLVAVSIYMESSSDQLLVADVMHRQLLPQSRNYLNEKANAIASMAAAHPADRVLAAYSTRAQALFGERAIPLLEQLYRRTGDPNP